MPQPAAKRSPLESFHAPTREWFRGAFEAATAAQLGAWEAINAGDHALVVAPTGSGKTLAAFLAAIDALSFSPIPQPELACRVLYISPLKALASDIERNLTSPLVGIEQKSRESGISHAPLRVAVRTGDTPAAQRRKFASNPSDILITTPESLYLLLTSNAREALRGVETVIIDEVHVLAGSKRGAHLALSLERLDAITAKPCQRIGLSATVRPVDEVAQFVAGMRGLDNGGRSVRVVQPPSSKRIEVQVRVPVPDMTDLGGDELDLSGAAAGTLPETRTGSLWPHIEKDIVDQILAHRSTIVFANSRRTAERLTARINEEYCRRCDGEKAEAGNGIAQPLYTAQANTSQATPIELARAHHGSMSRAERSTIESALKNGQLAAVVATSSLELGIDMGAVDLVLQVAAPLSVASGLQRIGRAGHQVGAPSKGIIFPTHRGELLACVVAAQRMVDGQIEALHLPRNPLDVLAQQIVAMVSVEDWRVDDLAHTIRLAQPFSKLGDRSLGAVLDMLTGRFPKTGFENLRPRIAWDRHSDILSARPGAARVAVISGGTIPDRGLYGVFIAGEESRSPKRVGELDEEMVFESRVGDVFTLGSSTWRITDITPNAVYVVPAPGQPGRLPFWHGDGPGRPFEFGQQIAKVSGQLAGAGDVGDVLSSDLTNDWAADNLIEYLREQSAATGKLPDAQTIIVEQFPDELGDLRIVIHSVWGDRLNAAWASVLSASLRERYGMDANVAHSDDGIVLRLPEAADLDADLSADLTIDPDEVEQRVTEALAQSAHFAARFREAAGRALLLPRNLPGKRQPLWQQRHRAAQLLDVASQFPDFPIIHEAVRECLQDDYDVPSLVNLMRMIRSGRIRLLHVSTSEPSPYARSLLFGYTAQFLYDGDAPLAERRAAALSLDPGLLAELLSGPGGPMLAEILDPEVMAEMDRELALAVPGRKARGPEELWDVLRQLGPADLDVLRRASSEPERTPQWLATLQDQRRALSLMNSGHTLWIEASDAGMIRDALGVALPVGLPEAYTSPVPHALDQLVQRYAAHHGPFTTARLAAELGASALALQDSADRLVQAKSLVSGQFRLRGASGASDTPDVQDPNGTEYVDPEILRRLNRRSLAAARRQVEPVDQEVLARFLPAWQSVGVLCGTDGVLEAIAALAGAALPASAIESLILPSRVSDYQPSMLDELISAGEVSWCGENKTGKRDGLIRLFAASTNDHLLANPGEPAGGAIGASLLGALESGGAFLIPELVDRVRMRLSTEDVNETDVADPEHSNESPPHKDRGAHYAHGVSAPVSEASVVEALWDLVWSGLVTCDSFAPLRSWLSRGKVAPKARTTHARAMLGRRGLTRSAMRRAMAPTSHAAIASGRWSLCLHGNDPTERTLAQATALLERHGVLTRGAAVTETSFSSIYSVLAGLEERGAIRRGYFVDHLGGSQFAVPEAPDQLRSSDSDAAAIVLCAADPANAYGVALPWPSHPTSRHRPRRAGGSIVVLKNGKIVIYLERGGHSALSFTDNPETLEEAGHALNEAIRRGTMRSLRLSKLDGEDALTARREGSPLALALLEAGFITSPSGLVLRGR